MTFILSVYLPKETGFKKCHFTLSSQNTDSQLKYFISCFILNVVMKICPNCYGDQNSTASRPLTSPVLKRSSILVLEPNRFAWFCCGKHENVWQKMGMFYHFVIQLICAAQRMMDEGFRCLSLNHAFVHLWIIYLLLQLLLKHFKWTTASEHISFFNRKIKVCSWNHAPIDWCPLVPSFSISEFPGEIVCQVRPYTLLVELLKIRHWLFCISTRFANGKELPWWIIAYV